MEIKTFVVDFWIFDKSVWEEVHYEITALTKEQLKEQFYKIVQFSDKNPDEFWLEVEKFISEEILIFPIIKEL